MTSRSSGWVATASALVLRPGLWSAAAGVARRLSARRRNGSGELRTYVRWRVQTAYGSPDVRPPAGDVCSYVEWCREMSHLACDTAP